MHFFFWKVDCCIYTDKEDASVAPCVHAWICRESLAHSYGPKWPATSWGEPFRPLKQHPITGGKPYQDPRTVVRHTLGARAFAGAQERTTGTAKSRFCSWHSWETESCPHFLFRDLRRLSSFSCIRLYSLFLALYMFNPSGRRSGEVTWSHPFLTERLVILYFFVPRCVRRRVMVVHILIYLV